MPDNKFKTERKEEINLKNSKKLAAYLLSSLLLLSACTNNDEKKEPKKQTNTTAGKEEQTATDAHTAQENTLDELTEDQVLKNPDSLEALVNKTRYLPSDYVPADLTVVAPDVISYTVPGTQERNMVRSAVSDPLLAMLSDSQKAGVAIWFASGYRSYTRQQEIFDRNVASVGYEETLKVVAEPGTSEHQTGLCIDFTAESVGFTVEENFEDTPEGKWLKENAHKYGFIMRYPKGKESITGYSYEPWHFRYVGEEIAKEIYEQNLTFEEYKNI